MSMSIQLRLKSGGSYIILDAQDISLSLIKIGVKNSEGNWNFYMRDTIRSIEVWDIK